MKELSFFKFSPIEYINADISFLPLDQQGLFIQLCCLYWTRDCKKMSREMIKQRFGKSEKILINLIEAGILKEDRDGIFISFLDEQFSTIVERHEILSKAGREGGIKSQALRVAKGRVKGGLKGGLSNKDKEEDKEEDKDTVTYPDEYVKFCSLFYKRKKDTQPEIMKGIKENVAGSLDTLDKLIRIDGFTLDDIRDVLKFSMDDDFWKLQIKSIAGLRKNGKNDQTKFINCRDAMIKKRDNVPFERQEGRYTILKEKTYKVHDKWTPKITNFITSFNQSTHVSICHMARDMNPDYAKEFDMIEVLKHYNRYRPFD